MPRLYEYMGIKIFFHTNEHEPIHVQGRYEDTESKIEIIVVEGIVSELRFRTVSCRKPLSPKNKKKVVNKKIAGKL